ncbi:MAG: hypothetical protein ACE15F_09975 [bacterium]
MASARTTHTLAELLEEVTQALRQMPDIPLSELKTKEKPKKKPEVDLSHLIAHFPQFTREEAETRLKALKQKELIELCKGLQVTVGSRKTKALMIKQILWDAFDSKIELERIRTYEETTSTDTAANE